MRAEEEGTTVKWSWRIGRIFGIALHIHATFLLAVAWGAATG